jgi:hypothetical protein
MLLRFSLFDIIEKLDTAAEMSMIVNERTEQDQRSLLAFPTTLIICGRQLPNLYHPPHVDTLASSLFRPRRDTLGCSAGFFYWLIRISSA